MITIPTLQAFGQDKSSPEQLPVFSDVKYKSGLNPAVRLGQTAAWCDYNADGWLDIFITNISRRYRRSNWRRTSVSKTDTDKTESGNKSIFLFSGSDEGRFHDVSLISGISDINTNAVSCADYNNDGFIDLAVGTNYAGKPPIIYKNKDGAYFLDVSKASGIIEEGSTVNHIIWADYDRDGFLDLLVAGSVGVSLYHNKGDGTFRDMSMLVGLGKPITAYAAVWFDADNDSDLDLFIAAGGQNAFYKNNGDGRFADATVSSGLGGESLWRTLAACTGDYNGDGFIDIYISNIGNATRNALYKNNQDGTFTDVTWETNTGDAGDGRTCAWVDFDADGKLDLLSTNHIQPTKLYKNMGDDTFVNVASDTGVDTVRDVFAASWGDYDRDGFIDVFLNGHGGTALLRNGGNTNNSLTLHLIGDGIKSNKSAIGARVSVKTAGGVQVREVSGGRGCCEQDMLPLYFGMGDETTADIDVTWPSGKKCEFKGISVAESNELAISETKCQIN